MGPPKTVQGGAGSGGGGCEAESSDQSSDKAKRQATGQHKTAQGSDPDEDLLPMDEDDKSCGGKSVVSLNLYPNGPLDAPPEEEPIDHSLDRGPGMAIVDFPTFAYSVSYLKGDQEDDKENIVRWVGLVEKYHPIKGIYRVDWHISPLSTLKKLYIHN